jgi:hypothetical protein
MTIREEWNSLSEEVRAAKIVLARDALAKLPLSPQAFWRETPLEIYSKEELIRMIEHIAKYDRGF